MVASKQSTVQPVRRSTSLTPVVDLLVDDRLLLGFAQPEAVADVAAHLLQRHQTSKMFIPNSQISQSATEIVIRMTSCW